MIQRSVFLALTIGVITALALTSCGGGKKGSEAELPAGKPTIAAKAASTATALQPTPTLSRRTPTAGTPVPMPAGWTRRTVGKFQIGVPADWMAIQVTPEYIDELIQEMGPTNPNIVPMLQALKAQSAVKFAAFDQASPPGYSVNVNVAREIKTMPLDQYLKLLKRQFEPLGWTITASEKTSLGGNEALRVELRTTVASSGGQPLTLESLFMAVDCGECRYTVALSYPPEHAPRYKPLFESMTHTFNVSKCCP